MKATLILRNEPLLTHCVTKAREEEIDLPRPISALRMTLVVGIVVGIILVLLTLVDNHALKVQVGIKSK